MPKKFQGFNGIRSHGLWVSAAVLYQPQLKLTSFHMELSCLLGITRCAPHGKISQQQRLVRRIFFRNLLREKYFPWELKIFCGFCINGTKNEKTESLNENENKENKKIDEFH